MALNEVGDAQPAGTVLHRTTATARLLGRLLGSPVARPNDRSGYTNDPDRWKGGPYVPGPGGTPAALANRTRDDGYGLKMEAPGGTQLTPASG